MNNSWAADLLINDLPIDQPPASVFTPEERLSASIRLGLVTIFAAHHPAELTTRLLMSTSELTPAAANEVIGQKQFKLRLCWSDKTHQLDNRRNKMIFCWVIKLPGAQRPGFHQADQQSNRRSNTRD